MLEQFKQNLCQHAFGMSKKEAQEKGICLECKQPLPNCHSPAGEREYKISGICEKCYDKLFPAE